MKASYNVICKTDLYHASKDSSFDSFTGIKVVDSFENLKDANDAILKYFREDAERYFANWGLACIFAGRPNDCGISSAGTNPDGTRYYSFDIYNYSIQAAK